MLSKRDKLLVKPWEDRRYQDHRSKVKSALPVIDCKAPPLRPHVVLKLKKCQREEERKAKIQSDNYSLLQRLNQIMRVNRLDNFWKTPLPNFHRKTAYDAERSEKLHSSSKVTGSRSNGESIEESCHSNVKCYACEFKKKMKSTYRRQRSN